MESTTKKDRRVSARLFMGMAMLAIVLANLACTLNQSTAVLATVAATGTPIASKTPVLATPLPAIASTITSTSLPVCVVATGSSAGRLNLRANAGNGEPVLAILKEGDQLRLLSNSGGWINVITPSGQAGWVNQKFVKCGG